MNIEKKKNFVPKSFFSRAIDLLTDHPVIVCTISLVHLVNEQKHLAIENLIIFQH